MNKRTTILRGVSLVLVAAGLYSCADHREMRTEIYNENVYLEKAFLTRANPNFVNPETDDKDDMGWLMGMTVTAVSVPTPISDIFPGLQNDTKYVRFGFSKDTMQLIDGVVPGPYTEDGNLPDPRQAADLAPKIIQEWPGTHVDIQLRKNLDGEVSNFVEENMERDWETRQHFKVDLEDSFLSELTKLSWYYDYSVSPAMTLVSKSVVPGSFKYVDTVAKKSNYPAGAPVDWDKGDYMEWTIRLNYAVQPWYSNLLNFAANTDSQTIDVKYSLWRRPNVEEGSEYVARPIAEKDKYKRKFGIWDYVIRNYQDPETGFIGAETMLSRYNPTQEIHFYMLDVPQEFREHPEHGDVYEGVAEAANAVFEEAGVEARVFFHEADEDGYIREPGDLRYNFVWWHNSAFTDIPWLGYGPSFMDPRTGEIVNATLNFNNWQGLHWYTYVVADLLNETSNAFTEGPGSCTPGERRPIIDPDVMHATTLFSKMQSGMDQPVEEWIVEHDQDFYDYYQMLLPELRYFYPPYSTFVYSGREQGTASMQQYREDLMSRDQHFWDVASKLDTPDSPTGINDFTSPGAIEAGLDFLHKAKDGMKSHAELQQDRRLAAGLRGIDLVDGSALLGTIAEVTQICKPDGTWQTFDEWEDSIRWRIAHQTSVHELGHNIGLYHNFYGSVDEPHYQPCSECVGGDKGNSSSVMDYVHHFAEVSADLGFYPYDRAAVIYAYRYDSQQAVDEEADQDIIRLLHPEWHDPAIDPPGETPGPSGDKHPERSMLFANDYHAPLSPMVETFDLGRTPTEMVYNAILYYDWMYKFRNFRSYRQYWQTWNYAGSAFGSTFYLRRFLDLWALDWYGSEIENDLRLLGVEGDTFDFTNIREEFDMEMGQANRMVVNFYQAILTQSNAERSYSTTYDSFHGDITRLGIIYDKFYAMMSFLGFWGSDLYNWDLYAFLAYYETNFGNSQTYSDSLNVLDAMLGGSYDVYPWFLPTAVLLFAEETHNINFADQGKKEWIGFRAFDRAQDMVDFFGFDPRTQCPTSDGGVQDDCPVAALGAEDDGHQTFHDKEGGLWTYVFLDDRNQHLTSSADLSPASYKLVWDHNEAVNIDNLDYVTPYDIKYFLDYYQYFD